MRFTSSLKLKLIYVFRINDMVHRGCLKIGEATCEDENVFGLSPNSKALNEAARKRINQYTQTAGIAYDLLYTELTVYNRSGLRSTTRRYTMFWNAPVSKRKSSIQSTRPMNGSSPIWQQSSVPLRLSRKGGVPFHQRKLPVNIPRLYSGRNSRKPSTRPRSSLRKVTRCSGTQRCVSERHFLPYRLSRTWSFSVL